jgi:transcriptional regulator with XRE-family HTH domain
MSQLQREELIMPRKGQFDSEAFYAALDATRQARELTWKQVAKESGVSASTLTRIAQGRRPDVDGLAALCVWAALDAGDFVLMDGDKHQPEPIAMISTYLRSDPHLSPEAVTALEEMIKAAYAAMRKD